MAEKGENQKPFLKTVGPNDSPPPRLKSSEDGSGGTNSNREPEGVNGAQGPSANLDTQPQVTADAQSRPDARLSCASSGGLPSNNAITAAATQNSSDGSNNQIGVNNMQPVPATSGQDCLISKGKVQ